MLATFADGASESDLKAANLVLETEYRKLALLQNRLAIYNTISQQMEAFLFNEQRLPSSYMTKNDAKSIRTMIRFRQVNLLIQNISNYYLATCGKVVIDIEKISGGSPLSLYAFTNNKTPTVSERKIHKRFLELKHFEANWPGEAVANRITPTHGGINSQTNKRTHKEAESINPSDPEVIRSCESYKDMLGNLLDKIK